MDELITVGFVRRPQRIDQVLPHMDYPFTMGGLHLSNGVGTRLERPLTGCRGEGSNLPITRQPPSGRYVDDCPGYCRPDIVWSGRWDSNPHTQGGNLEPNLSAHIRMSFRFFFGVIFRHLPQAG